MNLCVRVEVKEWKKLRGECYFVNNSILIEYDLLPSMALSENLQCRLWPSSDSIKPVI